MADDKGGNKDYSADQIQVLEGLDPVRKRPGMYIGSTGVDGLHHMVWEIVDNGIDEALAGHATHVQVIMLADGGISVFDDGRGIPTDIHPKTGKSTVETVLTVLHAGGKFGGDSGYKVSGGLHGVGSSVVNALSTRFIVNVYRDGKVHHQEYAKGVPDSDLKVTGKTPADRPHGTEITFYPDDTIFKEGTTFDYEKGAFSEIPMQWDDRSHTLIIGERTGEFPGMLPQRTFRVVLVSRAHPAGFPFTATEARSVDYKGAAIRVELR